MFAIIMTLIRLALFLAGVLCLPMLIFVMVLCAIVGVEPEVPMRTYVKTMSKLI